MKYQHTTLSVGLIPLADAAHIWIETLFPWMPTLPEWVHLTAEFLLYFLAAHLVWKTTPVLLRGLLAIHISIDRGLSTTYHAILVLIARRIRTVLNKIDQLTKH